MVTLHSSQLFTLYKSCDELVTNSSTIQYNEVFLCSIDGCVFPNFVKRVSAHYSILATCLEKIDFME